MGNKNYSKYVSENIDKTAERVPKETKPDVKKYKVLYYNRFSGRIVLETENGSLCTSGLKYDGSGYVEYPQK